MGESAILAHPSISTLRPTTANQVLYDGPATEVDSDRNCRLQVVARWLPSQGVRWTAHSAEPGPKAWSADAEVRFRLKARDAYSGQEVAGRALDSASGWMHGGAVVGRTEAAVLPCWCGGSILATWVGVAGSRRLRVTGRGSVGLAVSRGGLASGSWPWMLVPTFARSSRR
jgi:hypothetical protein